MEAIPISRFKATCLAVLERVRRTGEPVLVTRRGVPVAEVVPASHHAPGVRRLGGAAARGTIVGDVVGPVADAADWAVLRSPVRRP